MPRKSYKKSNLFFHCPNDFFDLKAEYRRKLEKSLSEETSLIEDYRGTSIAENIQGAILQIAPAAVYSIGNSYVDIVISTVCQKLGVPYRLILQQGEDYDSEILQNLLAISKKGFFTRSYACIQDYQEYDKELRDFITTKCDWWAFILPPKVAQLQGSRDNLFQRFIDYECLEGRQEHILTLDVS